MLRPVQIALIAIGSCVLSATLAQDLTLEQLIEKHTKAIGGRQAIAQVRSIEFALTITEPQFTVDAIYRADRTPRMRIDIYADGNRVFTEAYDGRKAWQIGDDGVPSEPGEKGTAALRNGVLLPGKLFGLHESGLTGNKLKLVGRETVAGTNFHVIELTTSSGDAQMLYISPDTWLIERTRLKKALHPDVDPTEQWLETRFSDFRKSDGVLRSYSHVEVNLESGAIVQTVRVREIVSNPAFDVSLFDRPRA